MKMLIAALCSLPLLACAAEARQMAEAAPDAGTMEVSRKDARPPARGPEKTFTGTVTITPLFDPNLPSQVGATLVRFEPGARTAWHKHPLGQRLVVLEGSGWTQVEGGPIKAIHAGDVVWCPPNVRHWHGATPTTAMAHIAIQETQNGLPVEWMEHVLDATYGAGPR